MVRLYSLLLLSLAPLFSQNASAAFTGTDVAALITGNAAGLALVGAAILGVVYGVRAFSWAKKI